MRLCWARKLWVRLSSRPIVPLSAFVILYVIEKAIGLRVDKQTEIEGLDLNLHGEVVP